MKNPEDKLPLRNRIRAEWHYLVSYVLRAFGYRRIADCIICGRKGYSLDQRDPDNIWIHFSEFHGDEI